MLDACMGLSCLYKEIDMGGEKVRASKEEESNLKAFVHTSFLLSFVLFYYKLGIVSLGE